MNRSSRAETSYNSNKTEQNSSTKPRFAADQRRMGCIGQPLSTPTVSTLSLSGPNHPVKLIHRRHIMSGTHVLIIRDKKTEESTQRVQTSAEDFHVLFLALCIGIAIVNKESF